MAISSSAGVSAPSIQQVIKAPEKSEKPEKKDNIQAQEDDKPSARATAGLENGSKGPQVAPPSEEAESTVAKADKEVSGGVDVQA